jgi:hypothetical protein
MSGAQHLAALDDHLDDVLVALHLRRLHWILG